jgi:hypothetical protein
MPESPRRSGTARRLRDRRLAVQTIMRMSRPGPAALIPILRRRRRGDAATLDRPRTPRSDRLHAFLAPVNERAAARAVQALVSAAAHLPDHPGIGR